MQFLASIKHLLKNLIPASLYRRLRSANSIAKNRRVLQKRAKIFDELVSIYGLRIVQGPFAGMKYLPSASGSEIIPKLLGTYEFELRDIIDSIVSNRYDRLIDIGSAEGYYAVGIAYRCPWINVDAYDIDMEARARCTELAHLNNLSERIKVKSEFTPLCMADEGVSKTIIICDCEGAELELFGRSDPQVWKNCDLLIELHDYIDPMITPSIVTNLSTTHSVRLIDSVVPDSTKNSALWFLSSDADKQIATTEMRVPMQWAWITRIA